MDNNSPPLLTMSELFQDGNCVIVTGIYSIKKTHKKKLPWENAVKYFEKVFHTKADDLATLKPYFVTDEEVDEVKADQVIKHLEPIVPDDYENGNQQFWTLGQLAALVGNTWFHGFINTDGAATRLASLPRNSWLLRFSTRATRAFTVSIVSSNKQVHHWPILPTKNPKNGKEVKVEGGGIFENIYKVVEYHKTKPLPKSECQLAEQCESLDGALKIGEQIGEGNFGKVFKAEWKKNGSTVIVAAKNPIERLNSKTESNLEYTPSQSAFSKDVIDEANTNKELSHPNIVRFYGIAVVNDLHYLVTEFCSLGSVHVYLSKFQTKELKPSQITRMAKETALAMDFLHGCNLIHRDLAARNLLLSKDDNGELIIKVSDFGLSRAVIKGKCYQKTGNHGDPVKWAAPETFMSTAPHDVFKGQVYHASDVWSFGILLSELYTFCAETPYPTLEVKEIKGMLANKKDITPYIHVKDAPEGVNDLITSCLKYDIDARPKFKELADRLTELEKKYTDSNDLNQWKEPALSLSSSQTKEISNNLDYGGEASYPQQNNEEAEDAQKKD